MSKTRRGGKKLLGIGAGLCVVFLATFAVGAAAGFLDATSIVTHLEKLNDTAEGRWTLGLIVIGLLAGDVVLPVPATPIMLVAGKLLGPWVGGAVCSIGAMGAAVIGYYGCRWGGRWLAARLIKPEEQARAERWLRDFGLLAVVVARGLPILPEVLAMLAGLSRLHTGKFLGAFALATIPFAFLHTTAGAYSSWAQPWPALLVLIGVPAATWTGWRLWKRG